MNDIASKEIRMATLDLGDEPLAGRGSNVPARSGLRKLLAALRRRHDQRRTLARISSLDQHLLRDVGFDPDDVRDALEGEKSALWEKWEELHGKLGQK